MNFCTGARGYSKNGKWCAYSKKMNCGYWLVRNPRHPYADQHGYIKRARAVVESMVGHIVGRGVNFHHIDHDREHDVWINIIPFEDQAAHSFFHARERAREACGNPGWRKCGYCHEYDDPENMYITPNGENAWHQECQNRYRRRARG